MGRLFFTGIAALLLVCSVIAAAGGEVYRLDTGDTIDVSVWGYPDLTLRVTVGPDGRISVPLLHELEVKGLTLAEVREMLTARWTEFVREPRVTVMLAERRRISVKVFGEVNKPGELLVYPGVSLAEIIAMAGGPTPKASLEEVQLLKGGAAEQAAVIPQGTGDRFGPAPGAGVPELADGDVVFVPRAHRFDTIKIKVFGQINDPGEFTVRADATVAESIAVAGGPTKRAALEKVLILRNGDPGRAEVVPQGRNGRFGGERAVRGPALNDGDLIYVPETGRIDLQLWSLVLQALAALKSLFY